MATSWDLNEIDERLIALALQEDLDVVFCDATTQLLLEDYDKIAHAQIISKNSTPVILCGLPIIRAILDEFQTEYKLTCHYQEGDEVPSKAVICDLEADAQTLLMAERTMLNFLRHLSAIATLTHQFTQLIRHTPTKILDTRKTTPGWRHLEKYAVACGGGVNHRMGLYDAIMVKDTHIDTLGGMEQALNKIPTKHDLPVIVEVRSITELQTVIELGKDKIDRVLLDNMSPDLMHECVKLCKGIFPTEASGNLNLQNIVKAAETGIDFASVGMLTHSAGNVDLSMRIIQI